MHTLNSIYRYKLKILLLFFFKKTIWIQKIIFNLAQTLKNKLLWKKF
jgi:hypothetical protein